MADAVQITFVDKGRTTNLTEAPNANDLITACEEALTGATNVTKLGVSSTTMNTIRKRDSSIEVRYPKPKDLTITAFNRRMVIDRILIPLSGEYAETIDQRRFVTVFYGKGRYEHGPYSNSAAVYERIEKALSKAGVSF